MSRFNRGGQGGRGFDRGGRGGRGFEKRMYSATCAECGDRCEVPFRPTGEKPVLCNDCFRGGDDRGQRRERRPDRAERPSRDNRLDEQFEQLNVKLDLIMKEIEKLKQPNKVHTLEADVSAEEKPVKKAKKAEKEDKKTEKKTAKKTVKKAEKKETKKVAKKATKTKKAA